MRFVSDSELATLTPAEQRDVASPIPTQVVSNGEFTPLPQSEDQRRVEARIGDLATELAPQHGMSRRGFLSSAAGMSAAFLAMNEVFGPVFTASRAEAATPGVADARAAALKKQFIVDCQTHFVRDDYNQQLLTFSADFAKKHWNPDIPGSRRPHPLQVPELREGDLHRQRHQGRDDLRHAHRRIRVPVPHQRPDRQRPRRRQQGGRLAPHPGARHRHARHPRLVRGDHARHDRSQARQHQGLHHRRPYLPDEEEDQLAHGRRETRLPAVRGHAQERHQHHLHPQGPDAGRLHDLVGRHVAVRHGLGRGQGGQGLAADQLRHLSLGHAAVPRAAGSRAGAVREDRTLRLGLRSRRHSRRSSASAMSTANSAPASPTPASRIPSSRPRSWARSSRAWERTR